MNLSPYRKILFYIAGAVLIALNELFQFGIDEQVYTEKVENIVEVILLMVTGLGVYQARNDKSPEEPA